MKEKLKRLAGRIPKKFIIIIIIGVAVVIAGFAGIELKKQYDESQAALNQEIKKAEDLIAAKDLFESLLSSYINVQDENVGKMWDGVSSGTGTSRRSAAATWQSELQFENSTIRILKANLADINAKTAVLSASVENFEGDLRDSAGDLTSSAGLYFITTSDMLSTLLNIADDTYAAVGNLQSGIAWGDIAQKGQEKREAVQNALDQHYQYSGEFDNAASAFRYAAA